MNAQVSLYVPAEPGKSWSQQEEGDSGLASSAGESEGSLDLLGFTKQRVSFKLLQNDSLLALEATGEGRDKHWRPEPMTGLAYSVAQAGPNTEHLHHPQARSLGSRGRRRQRKAILSFLSKQG